MKKTNLKVMDNTANTKQAIKKETEQRYDGKAIAFIKSRKAEHKIHKMAEEMYKTAELAGVELVDVIVDDSANDDIDRREITDFCKTVDDTDALVVLVNNLFAFQTLQYLLLCTNLFFVVNPITLHEQKQNCIEKAKDQNKILTHRY